MPYYEYTAIARDGSEIKGKESTDSLASLEAELKKRRLVLVKARERKERQAGIALTVALVTELSRLLGNGVALDRALQIISEDTVDARLGELAYKVRQIIKRGDSFSHALTLTGGFDSLLVTLVRVGENSGQLPETLAYLEKHYQTAQSFRSEILTTLAYPMVIAVMSLVTLVGMAVYVIPSFREIFAGQEQHLPLGTRMVFYISDWLLQHGVSLIIGFFFAILTITGIYRATPALQNATHRLLMSAPFLGGLLAGFEASKMLKVLGLMLKSGVPLVSAMELARQTFSNRVLQDGTERVIQQLRKGVALPVAVEEHLPALPKLAHRFLRLGNETGRLPENCAHAAEILRQDFTVRIKTLISILDPLIIIFMGGIVGFIVASMLLAVFGMSDIH